jgi:hypothetical protein
MTLAGTMALICWLGFFSLSLYGLWLHTEIEEAVDRAQSPAKPQEMSFLDLERRRNPWRLFPAYRSLYPSGRLLPRYWIAVCGSNLCIVAAIALLFHAMK